MKQKEYEEEYYVTLDGSDRLYIREVYRGNTWGWHYYYDKEFRMCASCPKSSGVKKISHDEFRALLFAEKL